MKKTCLITLLAFSAQTLATPSSPCNLLHWGEQVSEFVGVIGDEMIVANYECTYMGSGFSMWRLTDMQSVSILGE